MSNAPIIRGPIDIGPSYRRDCRERMTVRAGLHSIGSQAPYFSITADTHDCMKRGDEWVSITDLSGGCQHDLILAHFPELRPIVALHLSDYQGVPMHAVANGAYWIRRLMTDIVTFGADAPWRMNHSIPSESQDTCFINLCKHYRLDQSGGHELVSRARTGVVESVSHYNRVYTDAGEKWLNNFMRDYVASMTTTWAEEAAHVIKQFDLKVFTS